MPLDAAVAELAAASSRSCDLSSFGLERLMLAAARQASATHDDAVALALCADVAALERDRFLVGDMTDAQLGTGALDMLEQTCRPLAEAAPDAAVATFRAALTVIRNTSPPSLEEVMRRDRDEMFLLGLGALRDEMVPPCERARRLMERAPRATTSAELETMVAGYRTQRSAPRLSRPTYDASYSKGLGILERFVSVRGR